jgi:hypothetical protein
METQCKIQSKEFKLIDKEKNLIELKHYCKTHNKIFYSMNYDFDKIKKTCPEG